MAKFSKAQYELLTEAFGLALADVRESESPLMENVALRVAGKIADELKFDNDNFDIKQFMDGIEATHKILEYEQNNSIPHIPIVAITANALKGDRERFTRVSFH